jgi:hypothetical protein
MLLGMVYHFASCCVFGEKFLGEKLFEFCPIITFFFFLEVSLLIWIYDKHMQLFFFFFAIIFLLSFSTRLKSSSGIQ